MPATEHSRQTSQTASKERFSQSVPRRQLNPRQQAKRLARYHDDKDMSIPIREDDLPFIAASIRY